MGDRICIKGIRGFGYTGRKDCSPSAAGCS